MKLFKNDKKQEGIEDFLIADSHNEGFKLRLLKPNGEPTKFWLIVKGCYSDSYLSAYSEYQKYASKLVKTLQLMEEQNATEKEIKKFLETDPIEHENKLVGSLIADWNLVQVEDSSKPLELNQKNISFILKKAPQLKEGIIKIAQNNDNFTKKK